MPPLRPWGPIFEELTALPPSRMSSTVFAMLPTSLQTRLPPLRSLRKSASMQTLTSSRQSHTRSLSGLDGVHPNINQARIISESTQEHMSIEHHQSRTYEVRSPADYERQSVEYMQQPPPIQSSNVDWRFAQQGLALISVAQDELRSPSRRPAVDFERKAFLDGVEYILKALPNNLNEHELHRLRESTPVNFIPPSSPNGRSYSPSRDSQEKKSILHKSVQSAVVNIILLCHLALPYMLLLVRFAARTEREYRVSENLVGAGMGLANAIGSNGIKITGAICNVGDGRVGQVVTEAIAWTVEGFTAGLSDGVGEGLSIVGAKRQP